MSHLVITAAEKVGLILLIFRVSWFSVLNESRAKDGPVGLETSWNEQRSGGGTFATALSNVSVKFACKAIL